MREVIRELREWADLFGRQMAVREDMLQDRFRSGEYSAYKHAAESLAERADQLEAMPASVGFPVFQEPPGEEKD
jgi:hypothetical protein